MIRLAISVLLVFLFGCAESNFRLSDESRLPYFYELPDGERRDHYKVDLAYYSWPGSPEAVLELKKRKVGPSERRTVSRPRE